MTADDRLHMYRLRKQGGLLDRQTLRSLLAAGAVDTLVSMLAGLDEARRRELAPEVEAYVKQLPVPGSSGRPSPVGSAVAALVGCATRSRVLTLLRGRHLRWRWGPEWIPIAVQVAKDRGVTWLADIAGALADRLPRDTHPSTWQFVAELVVATGAPVPQGEPFVRGWLRHVKIAGGNYRRPAPPVADRLTDGPWLDALLPRLFDIDGIGTQLLGESVAAGGGWTGEPVLPIAVAGLVHEGRLDRITVLDGCITRFLRGDSPRALSPFIRIHHEIGPTVDELTARAADYGRLLAAATGTVAGLAQTALRVLDDAGLLDLDTILEPSRSVLARADKTLVRAQLRRLDKLAGRHGDRRDEILDVVAEAWRHPVPDIQQQALAVVERHRRRVAGPAPAALLEAAAGLDADLLERVHLALGATPVTRAAAVPREAAGTVPVPSVAPLPEPIASLDELAAECSASLTTGGIKGMDSAALDRLIDGLVRWTAADPRGVAVALRWFAGRHAHRLQHLPQNLASLRVPAALPAAVGGSAGATLPEHWNGVLRYGRSGDHPHKPWTVTALERLTVMRLVEVGLQVRSAPVPALVATPTHAVGVIDPAVLVERLERAERDGWQPWTFDLAQSLLRLPRACPADVAERAAALRSPAGVQLAARLAAGPVEPVSTLIEASHAALDPRPARTLVRLAAPDGYPDPFGVFTVAAPSRIASYSYEPSIHLWPAVAPAYAETVAAHALNHLAATADQDERGGGCLLVILAGLPGPFGAATALALAYGLGARLREDRVGAVDALLAFAAGGTLDMDAVGAAIGHRAVAGTYPLARVTDALGEASRAGATAAVWHAVCAALPILLARPTVPRGTPDLLALASRMATGMGPAAVLPPIVHEAAGRTGPGRLLTEARRLVKVSSPAR